MMDNGPKRLNQAMRTLNDRLKWGGRITFNGLLSRWSSFVAQVTQGYPHGMDEYLNDLSIRNAIAEVLHDLPSEFGKALELRVSEIDERFRDSTLASNKPLGHYGLDPKWWWWQRIPKLLMGDLRADLASEDFRQET